MMRAMLLALCFTRLLATEVTVEQREKSDLDEIREIQKLMVEVADALRADRHDQSVQAKGKEIEERIAKLGHEADEKGLTQANSQEKKANVATKYVRDSNIPARVTQKADTSITRRYDNWARLPNQSPVTASQNWSNDVPVKWRKRIAAYFISVQDEEVKREEYQAKVDAVSKEDFERAEAQRLPK